MDTNCCSIEEENCVHPAPLVSTRQALVLARYRSERLWRRCCRFLRVPASEPRCTCWWSWSLGRRCRNSSRQATLCDEFSPEHIVTFEYWTAVSNEVVFDLSTAMTTQQFSSFHHTQYMTSLFWLRLSLGETLTLWDVYRQNTSMFLSFTIRYDTIR